MPSPGARRALFVTMLLCTTAAGARAQSAVDGPSAKMTNPPVAAVRPHTFEKFGHQRIDNYYWLRDRENPQVISYLEAENAYLESTLAHTKELRQRLFEEFKTRIKQSDETVPYRLNGYWYYSRTIDGKDYRVFYRRKDAPNAAEEVLLDANREAEGHPYYANGPLRVSDDTRILAYGTDTVGRRFYTLRFRDLQTGQDLPDVVADITSSYLWAADNRTIFYAKQDPHTLRSSQIYRHILGSSVEEDELVYEEVDPTFSCYVGRTKSREFLLIGSHQTVTTEYLYLRAKDPTGKFQVIEPRRREHEYAVDHFGDHFYFVTNDTARNFRLMRAPVEEPARKNWEEVVPHRPDVLLEGIEVFHTHLVMVEREEGLLRLQVRSWGGDQHYVEFGEPAYDATPIQNVDISSTKLRFQYSSLTTPNSVYEYDLVSGDKKLLKRDEVLGGFKPEDYRTERIYAKGHDGVRIPISLVYRVGEPELKKRPLLQYGYGSYGYSIDAGFNPFVVSLLDRGFVYAIAHIRGGQEMGRAWYEDGRQDKKKNTFRDFISCTEHLVQNGYADPKRIYAMGGSAGGLLVGAVMNMRPDLYHGMVAAVPFVDVVTTMLDESIPLTTSEYDEWGNPNDQRFYEYLHSYSPYDQVDAKEYPNLLVTSGLHDSQVQFWEPTKWVAKLRAKKKGNNRVLLYTNMEAGHGGASARYEEYEERARIYAFLLDLASPRGFEPLLPP